MPAIYQVSVGRVGTQRQDMARSPAYASDAGLAPQPLLVGAAKRSITPTVIGRTVFLAGYQRGRLATDVHDELWVRAVAIRCREVTLILVTLDLVGLFHRDVQAIRGRAAAAGVPTDGLIVSCTGNHSGPDTLGLWRRGARGLRRNRRYADFLRTQVAQVIRLAMEAAEPAQAYLACVEMDELGIEDETATLSVMQLRTLIGQRVVTIVNGPLVPQFLPESNTAISADFLHWLYLGLERTRDDLALYVCSEAGEPSPVRERSWREAERVGTRLAALVRRTAESASPLAIARLAVWRKPIAIPLDRRGFAWPGHGGGPLSGEWRRESEVAVVEFGPLRMVALPGLAAPDMGFELRKVLDAPYRWLLSQSNDSLGTIRFEQILPVQAGFVSAPGTVPERETLRLGIGTHISTIIMDQVADLMLEVRGRLDA